jgi:hypothetical protein
MQYRNSDSTDENIATLERVREFAETIRLRGYRLKAHDAQQLVDALEAIADDMQQLHAELREVRNAPQCK